MIFFELGLDMTNLNKNKQNIYDHEYFSYNKGNR